MRFSQSLMRVGIGATSLLLLAACASFREPNSAVDVEEARQLMANPWPMPAFITAISPIPGSTVSLSNPDDWGSGYASLGVGDICVHVTAWLLLEPGDLIEQYENIELSLDHELLGESDSRTVLLLQKMVISKDGLEGRGPSELTDCWVNRLVPGLAHRLLSGVVYFRQTGMGLRMGI